MITPDKLYTIHGGQRRRKLALCFGALERDIAGIAEPEHKYSFPSMTRTEYTKTLVKIVLEDPDLPQESCLRLKAELDQDPFDERRVCNYARNELLKIIGTFPAEWDLVIAPHKPFNSGDTENSSGLQNKDGLIQTRDYFPGIMVYAEDIRSPFNVGSIFRTAEAIGAEKVFISPDCTDPNHPRAQRSGMGCIDTIPWERCTLEQLPMDLPVFVLETGGTPISEFEFPKKGIVIIGSEELGVSPQALKRGEYGRVSIPMKGLKASLNVGVAFGILMEAWISAIC